MSIVITDKIKRVKKNKSLVNGAIFSIYSFINRGFSFILLMILANFITPTEYGYLSLWGTVVMVLGYFISMSTDGYLEVSYFRDGKSGIANTFSCIFFTTIIMVGVFTLTLVFFGNQIGKLFNLPVNSLYLALIISFFTVYTHLNLNLFRVQEKVGSYGLFSCSNALLNFILSVILVKYLQQGWMGRVNAQFLCFSLFGIIGIFIFIKGHYFQLPNIAYWKSMLKWGIPLIPHLATTFIRQGCDKYIINGYHTIEDVGLFSFALNLATIVSMIGMGFNQANSVDIYKVLGDKKMGNAIKKEKLRKQKNVIRTVYIVIAIIVIVSCYLFIPLIFPKYTGSIRYIPFLSIYAFFICLYFLYTNFLFFYKKTKNLMYVTLASALVHLCLSLLLTKYSLYLTSIIYCFTQFLVFILIRHLAIKEIKVHLC